MKLPRVHISLRYGRRLDVARDWFVLLIFAFLGLIAGVLWSGWLFIHVASGGILGHTSAPNSTVFNAASLTAIEEVIHTREAEEAKFMQGAHSFVDPSK